MLVILEKRLSSLAHVTFFTRFLSLLTFSLNFVVFIDFKDENDLKMLSNLVSHTIYGIFRLQSIGINLKDIPSRAAFYVFLFKLSLMFHKLSGGSVEKKIFSV